MKQIFLLLMTLLSTIAFADVDPADAKAVSLCEWAANRLAPSYRAFLKELRNPRAYLDRENVKDVLRVRPADCQSMESARKAAGVFARAVQQHSGKVGVLLQLTGPNADMGQAMKAGIEGGAGELAEKLVFRDASSPSGAMEAIADLFFRENVSMIIASGDTKTLGPVNDWADSLVLPLLLLSGEEKDLSKSRNAFRVFPRPYDMSETLIDHAKEKGWGSIAILRPADGQSDALFNATQKSAGGREIKVTSFDYQSGDYRSMDESIRNLFQIDPKLRAVEYRRLKRAAELKAETTGVAYDPRSIILRPIIEVDAVVILDNFRIARHFAKIMKFHGAHHLPLMGDMGWRSEGLIEPPEPFLFQSVFADYMGSCTALPKKLQINCNGDFVEAQSTSFADFSVIGWRAARIASSVMAVPRAQIPKALLKLNNLDPETYGGGPVFNADHTAKWSVHLFGINREGIHELDRTSGESLATSP